MSDFAAAYGMKRKKHAKSPISGNMDIAPEEDMVAAIMNKRAVKNGESAQTVMGSSDLLELNEDAVGKENYDEVELSQPEDSNMHGDDLDGDDMISSIRRKLNVKRQFGK